MKDLIKQILREYTEPTVTFKVVGNVGNNINEAAKFGNFSTGEKIYKPSYEKSKSEFKPEVPKEVYDLINTEIKQVNPFFGHFVDKYTGEKKRIEFNLATTKHYIDRLYRLSDPEFQPGGKKFNPKLVTPTPLEGIDMIVNNRDKLTQEIVTKRIKDRDEVEISSIDGSRLNVIVIFDYKKTTKNVPVYTIHLKNQIKGDKFYDKRWQKQLKVYPYPTK
jgi:hypothetical protein